LKKNPGASTVLVKIILTITVIAVEDSEMAISSVGSSS
jgi:hypothetical protein